jgi:MFS family permease
VIEGGMIALGTLLAALSVAGPISRLLQRADGPGGLDLTAVTSLLAIVVVIAFFAGIAYGLVAIPSQTQLQEDLPADVRGRVFGVLNMLVSVASFLPIIIVGPISDLVGTTAVIFVVALGVLASGVASVMTRGPLLASESRPAADPRAVDPIAAALGADRPTWSDGAEVRVATTRELIVTPGTPTGLEPSGITAGLDRAGPSDPTDRD